MSTNDFSEVKLPPAQIENLTRLGYLTMTEVQEKGLPHVLAGNDVIAQAKTGSGKTAVFSLGMLEQLNLNDYTTQALVICPTRELCTQIAAEIRRLGRYRNNLKVVVLSGGQSTWSQTESMKHPAHIVVGTPGRLLDHIRKESLRLSDIKTLVLDEADRMLEMGFVEDIRDIIAQTPTERQTLFFSASYPPEIKKLSTEFQKSPIEVSVQTQHSEQDIKQSFYLCSDNYRFSALCTLIAHHQLTTAVIFCNTKQAVDEVCQYLCKRGYSARGLHGDMEQFDRNQALIQFGQKSCSFLVATDVASRGLDIEDLPCVINYDLPTDEKTYLHRVGRTGRAGKRGVAMSLVSEHEKFHLDVISEYLKRTIKAIDITTCRVPGKYQVRPAMKTISIRGGRKNKIRPGDILGALTGNRGISGSSVGKINIFDNISYVAIEHENAQPALKCLQNNQIKGKTFRVHLLKDV